MHQQILASSMGRFPTSFSHFEHRLMKALYLQLYLWREYVPRVFVWLNWCPDQ